MKLQVLNRKLMSFRARQAAAVRPSLFARLQARQVAAAAALLAPGLAFAGTDSTFDTIFTQLSNWCQGSFGRLVTMMLVIVGIVGGIGKQSLLAFGLGLGGGIGLYNLPTIIQSLLTATIV